MPIHFTIDTTALFRIRSPVLDHIFEFVGRYVVVAKQDALFPRGMGRPRPRARRLETFASVLAPMGTGTTSASNPRAPIALEASIYAGAR